MAELVAVAAALTSPCSNALVGAGISSTDVVAQSGSETCGLGHSWMPLVPTKHAIVKLDHFSSVGDIDPLTHQAWLGAGAKLHDLSPQLSERGYAFRNLGDIDVQTLAGATSTGTHGTGKELQGLAAEIQG